MVKTSAGVLTGAELMCRLWHHDVCLVNKVFCLFAGMCSSKHRCKADSFRPNEILTEFHPTEQVHKHTRDTQTFNQMFFSLTICKKIKCLIKFNKQSEMKVS